jgi:16S rRNA (guanine966-N2)-methyltransferase
MRIIAGRFKGRRLAGPGAAGLRPTSDSLRETLFNVLGPSVEGAVVLDGFAGTGALGLEALSRGATCVLFVERDKHAIGILEENIRRCRAENACVIVKRDFFSGNLGTREPENLRTPEPENPRTPEPEMFDLVLLDPPYDVKNLETVIGAAVPLLKPSGRLVLEHSRRRASPEEVASLRRARVLAAGDSALSFYGS